MDQNTYETYELPLNNGENVPDQFFIVQDDGTLLINRQIHFVTEIEESKDDIQSCTVDVPSQQLFVDVGKSAELITLSDQLVSPVDESTLYNGSFLLQPGSSSAPQEIGEPVINQIKHEAKDFKINIDNTNSKQTNVFTEITLSDEQYKLLEEKGWILLEFNDKIFVLNTLGLHDITENDILIQKLRDELQNSSNSEASPSCLKNEHQPIPTTTLLHDLSTEANINLINDNSCIPQTTEDTGHMFFVVENEEQSVENPMGNNDASVTEKGSVEDKNSSNAIAEVNSLKIKTKLSFKDIPDKIFLGKSRNGKSLYAKVKNCSKPIVICEINEANKSNQQLPDPDMGKSQFLRLVFNINDRVCDRIKLENDKAAAKLAITEIYNIPNFRHYIIGQYIFITRIIHKRNDTDSMYYKSKPSLLTAVVEIDDKNQLELVHSPNILDEILRDLIDDGSEFATRDCWKTHVSHIHIKEMQSANNIKRVFLTLAKQELTFLSARGKPRRRPPLHACSSCATVFSSEQELEVHLQNQCLGTDGPLTTDSESSKNPSKQYTKNRNGNQELYSCLKCEASFSELSACEKHVHTHYLKKNQLKMEMDSSKSNQQMDVDMENSDTEKKVFKCTMCPGRYMHSSTFSKHIISQHIKLQLN